MKAVIFTLGCKVNSKESLSIKSGLLSKGFKVSEKLEYADLYVINTCAVTAEAEKKSRQAIARVKKYNPNATVYVVGCASQKNPKVFIERGAKVVMGTKSKDKLLSHLSDNGIFIEQDDKYYEEFLPCKSHRTREYVKIQDGCDNYCAYCIIPYLRGSSRSRKIQNIVNEIEYLNPAEVVLTGINVSAFDDEGKKLPELIQSLTHLECRVRFGSLEVGVIDENLMQSLKKLKCFAPHFHLSLQSGSDNVLKAMNRKYTTAEYLEKVNLIRKYFPDAGITTDIIVGYSAETEQDFNDCLSFCDKVEFSDIHCFPYSVREGTEGAKLKPIDDKIKKQRLNQMMQKKAQLKGAFIQKNLNSTQLFIAEEFEEGYTVGYTGNYIRVYIKGEFLQASATVKLVSLFRDGALCEVVK